MARVDGELRRAIDLFVWPHGAKSPAAGERLPRLDFQADHRHHALLPVRASTGNGAGQTAAFDSRRALIKYITRPALANGAIRFSAEG